MTPLHAAALAYARAGIPVFPVRVGAKEPLPYSNGFKDATTDENTINAWWEHADYNLAIEPEQAGWCVVDLDGQEGIDAWSELCGEHEAPPPTYTVATPSGGLHLYFSGSLPPSVRKLGPKIDTRGRGSYVLIPPSIIDGTEYRVAQDADPAELSGWIEERCSTAAERKTAEGDFEIDSPERVAEGRRRIALERRWNGEPQIGQGSDDRAYKLVARLREIGLGDDTIVDMLEQLWAPHFDREWIAEKVTNGEKYAQNERGSVHVRTPGETYAGLLAYCAPAATTGTKTTAPLSEAASGESTSKPSAPSHSTDFAETLAAIQHEPAEPVEWVWQDRLLMGKANLYTGDAGVGKTTLAENIAVAVSCGAERLLNVPIPNHMPTLLLVAEDDKSQVRDNLIKIANGLDARDGFDRIYVRSVLTNDPEDGHLLARIRDGEIEFQPFMHELAQFICDIGEPMLVVIDPLAEFVAFDNIDPVACRLVARSFCRLITRFGAGNNTVLVNDHPSKSSIASGQHYAGSVQLKAAFDLFATLLPGEWSGTTVRQRELTLSMRKARYAAETETSFFRTSTSPMFLLNGAPGETRADHMRRVYEHIKDRLAKGMSTGRDKSRGEHPRSEVAYALDMTENDVKLAMSALVDKQWIVYKNGAGSGDAYVPAHFELGPVTPAADEGELAY